MIIGFNVTNIAFHRHLPRMPLNVLFVRAKCATKGLICKGEIISPSCPHGRPIVFRTVCCAIGISHHVRFVETIDVWVLQINDVLIVYIMRRCAIKQIIRVEIAVSFHIAVDVVVEPAYRFRNGAGRKCEEIANSVEKIRNKTFPTRIRILQRVVQTVRIPVVALCEPRCLHEVVGGEEAGDHGVVQTAVHVDDFQVGVVLVAGEATGKTEGACERNRRILHKVLPIRIAFHIPPRIEVQRTYHVPAAVGDVCVAAEAVGVYIVHAVHTVAAHANGGEAGGTVNVVVVGNHTGGIHLHLIISINVVSGVQGVSVVFEHRLHPLVVSPILQQNLHIAFGYTGWLVKDIVVGFAIGGGDGIWECVRGCHLRHRVRLATVVTVRSGMR